MARVFLRDAGRLPILSVDDFRDHGRSPEIIDKAVGLIDQAAIGCEGQRRQLLHRLEIFAARRALPRLQQARFQRRRGENFQIVAADFRVGIFAGDDLALFGDPDLAVHRAARLRDDGVIARPAAAADRTAAAVEQPQAHAVALEHTDQADLGLVEFPARGDETAVLVAVGIAEHHLLHPAAAVDEATVFRQRKQAVHDRGTGLQILDGLEQRHDVDRAAAGGVDETHLLQQQRHFQQIRDALAHGNDASGITSAPNLACELAASWNTASSPTVSSLYLTKADVSGRALRNSPASCAIRASSFNAR